MTVYVDLLILENIFMDYLILYTTGKLLNKSICKIRIFIASIIGGLCVLLISINLSIIVVNVLKIVMAILLIKISFNSKKIKNIISEVIVFLVTTFIYSGCALGFIHFFKHKIIYIVNGIIIGEDNIFEVVFISTLISYVLIKLSGNLIKIKTKLTKKDMICKMIICINNKKLEVDAFIDTGNLLSDPISKKPIVIVEKNKLENIITEKEINQINNWLGGDVNNKEDDINIKLRAIPFISLGNKNGMIITYKVDCVEIEYQNEIYKLDNVLVGIYNDTLTKNGKYSALLGLQILERSTIKNEYSTNIKDKGKYSVCKISK